MFLVTYGCFSTSYALLDPKLRKKAKTSDIEGPVHTVWSLVELMPSIVVCECFSIRSIGHYLELPSAFSCYWWSWEDFFHQGCHVPYLV